jgi:hypothetical protein
LNAAAMKRTLFAAGFAVLASLMFAPFGQYLRYGTEEIQTHAPFFVRTDGSILYKSLILQTLFAAILAAIIVNIRCRVSRRARWALFCLAVSVVLVVASWFGFCAFQRQMKTAAEREEAMANGAILNGNFEVAKQHLLNESKYWWRKGWWDGARDARQRAFDQEAMKKKAAIFRAQRDEERAAQLIVQGLSDRPSYASDKNVTEAKKLLLDGAEAWHIAGIAGEEQRLRAWGENLKKGRVTVDDILGPPSLDEVTNWDTKSVSVVWSEAHEYAKEEKGELTHGGFVLDYALQNNTDHDVTIPARVTIMQQLTKGGVLNDYSNVAKLRAATFLPARQRAQLSVDVQWGCGEWDFSTNKLLKAEAPEACYARCFAGSDGFILFDHANHLEISLPKPIFPKPKR